MLAERKNKYGITGNLITHFNSLFYYPKTGNDILSELLVKTGSKDPGLKAMLVMEQDYFFEPGSFKEGLLSRYRQGFRILRLFKI